MKTIQRHDIHDKIIKYLDNPQKILVIEGVRQTGKTTALNMALQNRRHTFITLTDEDLATSTIRNSQTLPELEKNLERYFGFSPDSAQALIIDEAQRSQHLYKMLMQIQKDWQGVPVILSGSVMGAFFHRHENKKVTSPAGRIEKIICRPFSFFEFLELIGENALKQDLLEIKNPDQVTKELHHGALEFFYDYLLTGGHPEAILFRNEINELFNYHKTLFGFFAQDADRYLHEVTGDKPKQMSSLFESTVNAIARLTGSLTKRSSLISTDSPAYRKDLPALLKALEEWHFIFRLPTKMKSMTTKPGTSSKKYLWDVGMMNSFLNMSRPIDKDNKDLLAKLLEAYTCQELIFYTQNKERVFSWKSQQKQTHELDFLAHLTHRDLGIEVKASKNFSKKALSQLNEFLKFNQKAKGYVVYLGEYKIENWHDRRIEFIPPYLLGTKLL